MPAGTVTVIVPLGGPQAVFVVAAIAFRLLVRLIVIVSRLVRKLAGLSQAEKVVRTTYWLFPAGGQ